MPCHSMSDRSGPGLAMPDNTPPYLTEANPTVPIRAKPNTSRAVPDIATPITGEPNLTIPNNAEPMPRPNSP